MNISSVSSAAMFFTDKPTSRAMEKTDDSVTDNAQVEPSSDTVSLSGAGLAASRTGSPSASDRVEACRVPDWLAEYGKDATVSIGDAAKAVAFRNARFDRLSSDEQSEYATLIQRHYRQLLSDNGVQSTREHNALMIQDKQLSETLRLSFVHRIASDSRLAELMRKIGLEDSVLPKA